jgi:hypothetical protein
MHAARGMSACPTSGSRPRRLHCRVWWVAAFTLLSGSAVRLTAEPARSGTARSAAAYVAAGFLERSEEPLQQYRAVRRMHAWSERFNQEAWLDAWTELKNGRFQYRVVSERGSDTIRTKVLYAMLNREQDLINSGDTDKADLTAQNYEFRDGGCDPSGAHLVQIKPRRKDVLLVDGHMVLTPDGRDLLRVEGRLAKNPSFWTSLVNVVRHYARVAGVRVPVATESTARVKFAGTSQLEVRYEYESVNNRRVNVNASRR